MPLFSDMIKSTLSAAAYFEITLLPYKLKCTLLSIYISTTIERISAKALLYSKCAALKKKKLSTEKTSYNLLYFLCMMKLSPGDVNPLS